MSDRIALVTGAGRGIGRSIAVHLAAAGHRVAVTARTQTQIDEVVREITANGGTALAFAADLTKRGNLPALVAQVKEAWGPIQILVNNAGIGSSSMPRPVVSFDDDFWDLTMELNVTVPYQLTKLVLLDMLAAGWGRVINMSSINAKVGSFHGAAYAASKHAIAGLTKSTAMEVAAHGVTCNAICPGVTATLLNDKRVEYDSERTGESFEELEAKASPLGRRLLPDEIAPLATFLASDGAGAINGQLLNVCGGTVMC